MGGGDEGGAQETGPVTVRKLLFRDGSLFAGDEAGSLCRWRHVSRREGKVSSKQILLFFSLSLSQVVTEPRTGEQDGVLH